MAPTNRPKCPVDHAAAKRDRDVWMTWKFVSYFEVPNDPSDPIPCEMRNCPSCDTSLSLPLDGAGRAMPEVYDCPKCGAQSSWDGALCWKCAG